MRSGDVLRIFLVVALIAPLVIWQALPATAPEFLNSRVLGAPASAVATVCWFITFMILTWLFAAFQERDRS